MAANLDLNIDQGTYWDAHLVYQDTLGNLIDLTGFGARMMARTSMEATAVAFSLATAGDSVVPSPTGTITLGGVAGTIVLELSAAATAAIAAPFSYRYDLELVPPSGKIIRLIQGRIIVAPEVTK